MNNKKIEFFNCQVCSYPYPTTGKFMLRNIDVCANCYIKNKRMFMWEK